MIFKRDRDPTTLRSVLNEDADILLWNNFRKGSHAAFESLYNRHSDSLYNYGIHFFRDKVLVQDAIQDLFLDLWRRREFLGATDSVKFYLYRSLRRSIGRRLKASARDDHHKSLFALFHERETPSAESDMITLDSCATRTELLDRAIRLLPQRQREIIIHRFYQNLSPAEISAIMSLGIDSTYTLLSRALLALKRSLKDLRSAKLIACLLLFAGFRA